MTMRRVKLTVVVLALALAIFARESFSGQNDKAKGVTISLIELANRAVHQKMLKILIRNSEPVTVFFPFQGAPGAKRITSLQFELLQGDNSWMPLPVHGELDPRMSKPLRIEPGATYEDEITLDTPYHVSAWIAYPKPPYDIPIKGKLRIKVEYFVGQEAWQRYVSARNQKSSENTQASVGQVAFSGPIELDGEHGDH